MNQHTTEPIYSCGQHGKVDSDHMTVFTIDGVVTRRVCSLCYMDWVAEHLPELEVQPPTF